MTRTRVILALILTVAGVCALVAPLAAKSGQNNAVFGPYEVIFKGEYQGNGKALVIHKKVVFIKGDLLEEGTGNAGAFQVMNMPLSDDGHFSGTGTFTLGPGKKVDVTVVGRVEPPDGAVIKKARIICTYSIANGKAGRIYGAH